MAEEKRYKKGRYIEYAAAIGIPIGVPIGLALGNIALGPFLGVLLGLGTGIVLEKLYNKNPIELSVKEKYNRRILSLIGLISGLVFFAGIFLIYFSLK